MLKYIKHHLENISGIEIYPIVSFLIFSIFFIVVLAWVMRIKKTDLDDMKNIPIQ